MSMSQSSTVWLYENGYYGEKEKSRKKSESEKAENVKPKIQWWKLKETSCQEAFRQEVTRILGRKDLPDE